MHTGRGLRLAFTAAAALAFAATPATAGYVAESEPNDSQATAQNLDAFFDLAFDSDITNSTTVPHASVRAAVPGQEGPTYDWYSFTVAAAGTPGLFDIDYGMTAFDSYLDLYDSVGTHLIGHDDGGIIDPGSIHGWDSYLNYTFANAGTYFVRVGGCCVQPTYGSYVLHVSLGSSVPEPSTWTMLLLGFGAVGATMRQARRAKAIPALV